MKLLTISFVIVCFGLPGCINARIFNDYNNYLSKNDQMQATSEPQNEFLLFLTPKNFSTSKYLKKNEKSSNFENGYYSFKNNTHNQDVTFNCKEKKIYVLSKDDLNDKKKTVEIISYDENKKFTNFSQVIKMFDNATSLAAEWTTDRIFWIEDSNKGSAIKVTDKLFSEPEYIVHPDDGFVINKIQVYPKKNKLFFSTNDYVWYTSTISKQTPKSLISPPFSITKIHDFTIDYLTDKLYWIGRKYNQPNLYCTDIGTSDKQLEVDDAKPIRIIPNYAFNLVVFNKSIYWTTFENNNTLKLFYKSDNTDVVEVTDLPLETKLYSISLTCPSVEIKEQLFEMKEQPVDYDWYLFPQL